MGSVLKLPFANKSFGVVACYEVLEHLPYGDFNRALFEIFRVSKSHAILSLPDASRVYRLNVRIPKIGEIKWLVPLPRLVKPFHNFNDEHCWEIGKAGYSLRKIVNDIQIAGFKIEKTYRVFECSWHRFLLCVKKNQSELAR